MHPVKIAMATAMLAVLAGCTQPTPAPATTPPGSVTFEIVAVPMVGGFCSYFAEDQPGKPCVDGVERVFDGHSNLIEGADSNRRIEITAHVTVSTQTRSNSANPPQTATLTVWQIDTVSSARRLN